MTDLDDRMRRGPRKVASSTSQSRAVRVLRVRKTSRLSRWLAPAAVLAAVVAVVAGVSLADGHDATTGFTLPTRTTNAAPSAAHDLPRYYVTVFQSYVDGGQRISTTAVVHDTRTGAALSAAHIPTLTSDGGTEGPGISAAGDDRTFLVTELGGNGPDNNLVRFYLLRIAADGRSVTVSRLPINVPTSLTPDFAALSPDGTRLATDVQSCYRGGCHYSGIRVVTIATGAVRTWTTRFAGAPFSVSWAGNSAVAFEWQSDSRSPAPGQHTGYRLLNVTGSGGNLFGSRPIASPSVQPSGSVPSELVTADQQAVVTSTMQNIADGFGTDTVVAKIVELSARTGRLLRVLSTTSALGTSLGSLGADSTELLDQDCNVLSLSPVGINVLVSCFSFGRVGSDGFTSLPGFPSESSTGISGQQASAW